MSSLGELQRNWEGLAQADPLWAICTDPARRAGKWSSEEFFATGQDEIGRVMECLHALRVEIDCDSPALDFGCGVGRLTRALAGYFPECWGVDISPTMIRLAKELNRDFQQCRFALNEHSDLRIFREGNFGFVYSSIVLQHIAPRFSRKYLTELARVTRPGGILIFQVLEEFRAGVVMRWRQKLGVRRRLRRLTGSRNESFAMEMHCVRESEVRRLMQAAGARVIDVRYTNSAEPSFNGRLQYLQSEPHQGYVSKQYCVIKDAFPRGGPCDG
jgi:ubiquinone/menaquinone biosynthesis C-methylase UbiE